MSSKFTKFNVDVQPEQMNQESFTITSLDSEEEQLPVRDFEPRKLEKPGGGDYKTSRAKYGPLAVTDRDRRARTKRDSQFKLSPLLREPLSVEQEERRVIDSLVQERVRQIQDKVREEAYQAAYRNGFTQGQQDSFKKFQEDAQPKLSRLEAFVQAAEQAKMEIFKENEKFIIETMMRVCRLVLLKETSADREYFQRLVKNVIEKTDVRENITVRLSPQEKDTLIALKNSLDEALGPLRNLNVEVSDLIPPGGCEIETEWNKIEAGIDAQLHAITEALLTTQSGKAEA